MSCCCSSNTMCERISEFIRQEVPDWDNEIISTARFKGFNGQRCDWLPKYVFWNDLIIKVAKHLNIFLINPHQVKNEWFKRGGLTPLCLDDVLLEMYKDGDILRREDLVNPTSGLLYQIIRRFVGVVGLSKSSDQGNILEDYLIISPLLKEKASEVVKVISESYWTSSCIITMRRFQELCGGSEESSAILSYLSGCSKAKYMTINKGEFMELQLHSKLNLAELGPSFLGLKNSDLRNNRNNLRSQGVKVSLSSQAVSSISGLDHDVLHLVSTAEKLQQQLDVINQRWEKSRKLALATLKSGNKKGALKHAREIKLASESREKCTSLLNRVEEVLGAIADAESTNKVSEAIQIGARAIKENSVSVEEVQQCLEELEETIDSHKQVQNVLESTPGIEDEDIEDEFNKLELELGDNSQDSTAIGRVNIPIKEKEDSKIEESLCNALSDLRLQGDAQGEHVTQPSNSGSNKASKDLQPELA